MEEKKIIAYKGFDKNMQCRGFQYEVGKTYETDKVKVCECGFHACENPFDVLNYYSDIDGKYCIVEQSGVLNKKGDKTASSVITIIKEISYSELLEIGVEWLTKLDCKGSGDSDQIGSSGNSAQIGSSGYSAKIGSSGYSAKIGSSGNSAQIGSSGYSAQIGSSGNYVHIGSSGYSAQIGSSGNYAHIGSSGYYAQIGSSGDYAQIGSSGDYAKIGSSGYYAKIGSSGNSAQIGSSGDYAKIGSSGYSAKIGSSGDYAQIYSTGDYSVVCCAGNKSSVKAKKGSWITLSEWEYDGNLKRDVPKCVKTEFVDGVKIKEDTWYKLVDGQFKEIEL